MIVDGQGLNQVGRDRGKSEPRRLTDPRYSRVGFFLGLAASVIRGTAPEVIVMQVMSKVDRLENTNNTLKKEIQGLKEVSKMTKTVIIRDTVFITEKKNFWGKTKTKIDSSQSTIVEDSIQYKL